MTKTIGEELKDAISRVISSRLSGASHSEVLKIANAICAQDAAPPAAPESTAALTSPILWSEIRPRFQVAKFNGDELVHDNQTGLMWTRTHIGAGRFKWENANERCNACRLGGFADWRLPTVQELQGIVDYERCNPAIETEAFDCMRAYYWTGTSSRETPNRASCWVVNFYSGASLTEVRSAPHFVRAVRNA